MKKDKIMKTKHKTLVNVNVFSFLNLLKEPIISREIVEQEVRVIPERVETEADNTKIIMTPSKIAGRVSFKMLGIMLS